MSEIGKKILSLINNNSKDRNDRGAVLPFSESKTIGILYSWDGSQKEEAIDRFIQKIQEDRVVDTLCFNPNKKTIPETKRKVISVEDLSILGKINSSEANGFLKRQFDYLFHLDFEHNEITQALLIKSSAKCRVGLYSDEHESLYELMIGINKSAGLDNLIEQMLKYVKALN